jgi:hypothetical protein
MRSHASAKCFDLASNDIEDLLSLCRQLAQQAGNDAG